MLEARYFRDYKHNYMILCCGQQAGTDYQCRLLTSGRIEGILRCSLRHINGESYFYYDISSRATLEGLYRDRKMTAQQIRELFEQLYEIYCGLGDCFMEESHLVLLPEHIYYDMSHKKYVGLYYPDYESDKPYEALMDFLLEHLDDRDEKLANAVYTIYERMEGSGFSLQDALLILSEGEETAAEREPQKSWHFRTRRPILKRRQMPRCLHQSCLRRMRRRVRAIYLRRRLLHPLKRRAFSIRYCRFVLFWESLGLLIFMVSMSWQIKR